MTIALITKGRVVKHCTGTTTYVNIDNISVTVTKDDPIDITITTDC